MSDPKRHHYVPEFLLNRFVTSRGRLYLWRKADGTIWEAVPGEAFLVTHLYSSLTRDGQKDTALERSYAALEGRAAPIVEKIAATANAGALPGLGVDERLIWNEFFYHQIARVHEFLEGLAAVRDFVDRLPSMLGILAASLCRELTAEERTAFQSPAVQARIVQNAKVKALADPGGVVPGFLAAMALEIGRCTGEGCFVIGSQPVVQVSLDIARADPRLGLWLPLSPKLAVRPIFQSVPEQITALDDTTVEAINRQLVEQSDIVVSGTRKHLLDVCGIDKEPRNIPHQSAKSSPAPRRNRRT